MGKVRNSFKNTDRIEKLGGGGGGDSSVDIVAEETKVGTFMGKDLYRRVFVAETKTLQRGDEIVLFEFDKSNLYIVDYKGVFENTTNNFLGENVVYSISSPNSLASPASTFFFNIGPNRIGLVNRANLILNVKNLVIYVYYTKENPFA